MKLSDQRERISSLRLRLSIYKLVKEKSYSLKDLKGIHKTHKESTIKRVIKRMIEIDEIKIERVGMINYYALK